MSTTRPAVRAFSAEKGAVGLLLPPLQKSDLFRGGGAGAACCPRKTFSMGHAEEKRYYIECRRASLSKVLPVDPIFPRSRMTFQELNLSKPILRAVARAGYEKPSPIQGGSHPAGAEGPRI